MNFLGEILQRILRLNWQSLIILNLHKMGLELAFVVSHADPSVEDKLGTRRETHIVVEVRRAFDRKVTKSPYMACQLSVFNDQQPITGLPGSQFGGLRCMKNSTVNTKTSDLY